MGHRVSTLARPGSKVQGHGGSQDGALKKTGVNPVREVRGRAFHVKETCSRTGRCAAACLVWGVAPQTKCHLPS